MKRVSRAQQRAEQWAAVLIAEGLTPEHARARAQHAYGLRPGPAPSTPEPRLTPALRRAWLETMATSHPGADGDQPGTVGARNAADSRVRRAQALTPAQRRALARAPRLPHLQARIRARALAGQPLAPAVHARLAALLGAA